MSRVHAGLRLSAAAVLLAGAAVQAQEAPWCGTSHSVDGLERQGGRATMPLTGQVRALLVFVRFADDDRGGDGCAYGGPMWPAHTDRPVFSDGLLSPTPGGATPDSSLTALFRLASSGHFELYGSTFGHVTRHPESHYFTSGSIELDRQTLTLEILAALRDRGIPLPDYDANGDGVLDQLIVVVRSFSSARGLTNCTLVDGVARCASGEASLFFGAPIPADQFGIAVDARLSGQYNVYQSVRPYADLVGLIAHETGHHLWTFNGLIDLHLDPIVGNRIPSGSDGAGALALMLGPGPMYAKTAFPTAAERHILSQALPASERWLECAAPEPGRTYELGDTLSANDCLRLAFGPFCTGCPGFDVLVSGVYRDSPFARKATPLTTVSDNCPGCVRVEAGLPATGVMLEAVQFTHNGRARRDLIPSDDHLGTFSGCGVLSGVGPTSEEVFGGDFWTAGARAIHPFSSPNIYGYASLSVTPRSVYDVGGPPHELSGFRTAASGRVAFDYRTDLLERDSLVAESDWSFGPQFGPLAFDAFRMGVPGNFVMADGTRLTVGRLDLRLARRIVLGADVSLVASEARYPTGDASLGLQVGARTRLVIPHSVASDAQPIQVSEDAQLHVQGSLVVRGALVVKPGAHLIVDGDLDLRSPTAQALVQGSVRVQGRLITPAGAERQLQVDGELDVGGAWEVGGGTLTISVGSPSQPAAVMRLRGGLSVPDDGRVRVSLAPGAEADVAGLLTLPAGSSLLLDRATLIAREGIRVEPEASMTLTGGIVRFGPEARLDVRGVLFTDLGSDAIAPKMAALDDESGWGGMAFGGAATLTLTIRNLNVSGVVGQPALLVENQTLTLYHVRIQAPRAEGAIVVRGGQVRLDRVEVGPTVGVGLDVSGGADVVLVPPVQLLGHRVALRVDASVVSSTCVAAGACPGAPSRILPDRSLPDAADVELWNGATLRLPYATWWVNLPDLLFVSGDGTGTLDVTPMGPAQPGAPVPPVLQEVGTVTPNPARASMSVPVSLSTGTTARLSVHDVLGRRVATQTLRLERGHHLVPLPIGFVPAGTYLLTVELTLPLREPTRHVQPFTVVR